MKILIYGAGVIGCIYAAKLSHAGTDITLLARGERYEHLKQHQLIINDVLTGKQMVCSIPLVKNLKQDDFYDLIIVTVRLDQLDPVIAILKQNTASPAILFMLNNPDHFNHLINELSHKKIILGFPGAGGIHHNNQVNFVQIKEQKTTIGDFDGKISDLTRELRKILEHAGFKVDISIDMQAWLKIHAVFIACVTAAIMKENGDSIQLGKNKSSVQRMVRSINEGFKACKKLGIRITPANLKLIFIIMPQWFSVWYWQKALQGKTGTLAIAPHANEAKEEMKLLAKKVITIVHSSGLATPTLDNLLLPFIHSD